MQFARSRDAQRQRLRRQQIRCDWAERCFRGKGPRRTDRPDRKRDLVTKSGRIGKQWIVRSRIDAGAFVESLKAASVDEVDKVGCERITRERVTLTITAKFGAEEEERLVLQNRAADRTAKLVTHQVIRIPDRFEKKLLAASA